MSCEYVKNICGFENCGSDGIGRLFEKGKGGLL